MEEWGRLWRGGEDYRGARKTAKGGSEAGKAGEDYRGP